MGWSEQVIPVRDDASEFPDVDRASLLLDLLGKHGISVAGRDVVDLGAGMGFLALGSAQREARSVTAYDVNSDRLTALSERAFAAGLPLDTATLNLLDGAPNHGIADLAFMIGVVEYAGLWNAERNAEALQVQVFRTAYEMLRPGGVLVLGTKNRLWPMTIVSEVHTRQPLVAVLPRPLADRLSYWRTGEPYRHRFHSASGWTQLIQHAGFRSVRSYVPYFSYQFPIDLVSEPRFSDRKQIASRLAENPSLHQFTGSAWQSKLILSALAQKAHLTVSQSLIFIAQR